MKTVTFLVLLMLAVVLVQVRPSDRAYAQSQLTFKVADLSDTAISSATVTNTDFLAYNGSNWVNKSFSTVMLWSNACIQSNLFKMIDRTTGAKRTVFMTNGVIFCGSAE